MNKFKKILFSVIAVCTTAAIGMTTLANDVGLAEPKLEDKGLVPGLSMNTSDEINSSLNPENDIMSAEIPGQEGLSWSSGLTSDNPATYDFGTAGFGDVGSLSSKVYLYNGSGKIIEGVTITPDSPDKDYFQISGPGDGSLSSEDYIDSDSQTISTVEYVLNPRSPKIKEDKVYTSTYTISGTKKSTEEGIKERVSLSITITLNYDDSDNPNHKVTFDSQGGTEIIPVDVSPNGQWPVDEPAAPTRANYTFAGWYTEPECKTKWDFSTNITQHRMTLYAKWTPDGDIGESFTVTYDSVGGSSVSPITGVVTGSKVNPPLVPKKAGYTFENWYKDAPCTELWDFSKDTVTSNITLYAKWKDASVGNFEYVKRVTTPSNGSMWIYWDNDKLDGNGKKIKLKPSDFDITYERADDPPKTLEVDSEIFYNAEGTLSCTYKPLPQTMYAQIVTITVVYKGQTEGKSSDFVIEPGMGSVTPDDGKCTVVLKNKSGSPISGAKVSMIKGTVSGEERTDIITDTNGEALFQLDPRSTYIMLVEKNGYYKIEWPPRSIGQTWNVYMEEVKGNPVASGYCNFTVVDENNNPVPDARIAFICPGDNTSGNGMTGPNGQSRILVNKNTYELMVIKEGYENYQAIFPVMSAEQSLEIQLKPGESVESPDFETICTVRTMVRDPAGNPVPNANISFFCPTDNQIGKSVSSNTGLSSPPVYIRSNNYTLTVSKVGYEKYEKTVVVSGDEKTFDVVLTPIAQIGGDGSSSLPPPSNNTGTNTNNNNNNNNNDRNDRDDKPSSSGSGSSTSKPSKPSNTNKDTSSKVDSDTVAKKTTEAIQEQLKNNSSSTPTVTVKNADPISQKALKSMAETAKHSNAKVQLQADSVDKNGNIEARLYIDPLKAGNIKGDISLGVSLDPEKTKAASDTFEKYFDNEIAVVHFDQKGTFGMPIDVAVKVDLTKLDTKSLQFYSYDSVKNTYAPVAVSSYYVDSKGYLHFPTGVGNDIVITDKPLTKK